MRACELWWGRFLHNALAMQTMAVERRQTKLMALEDAVFGGREGGAVVALLVLYGELEGRQETT